MSYVQEFPPLAWIVRLVMGMIGFAITGRVLYYEVKKRRLPSTQFHSHYLRWTSAVCVWTAPIPPLLFIFGVIPGFCMIRFSGSIVISYTQIVFLSFYQLSRLHYCFSNQQLHGKKGYPQWIFILMVIIGFMLWISVVTLQLLVDILPSKCRYTGNGFLFYRYGDRAILFDRDSWDLSQIYWIWVNAVSASGHTWDLVILLMYLHKIWQIRKAHKSKENRVWDNVLSILHRIVIITVFYTICSLFLSILFTLSRLTLSSENMLIDAIVYELETYGIITATNLLYFFSILLMMQHNTHIYVVFLCFLRRFHLKYCCFCCYHKMVDQQLAELEIPEEIVLEANRRSDATAEIPGIDRQITRTMFSNLSKNVVYESNASAGELSCETVTRVVNDELKV